MSIEIIYLKKLIRYRLSYSGTKETDIIYKKIIFNKLDILEKNELLQLSKIFENISDIEIFDFLTNKQKKPFKYKDLLNKLIDE